MKTILCFHTELMPYTVVVIRELASMGYQLHVVYYDKNRKVPYTPPKIENVTYYSRYDFSYEELIGFSTKTNPSLLWTSGWVDSGYNRVSKVMKDEGIPVVAGSDTQWRGGKQWFNVLTSPFRMKRWFTHLFVAGVWQYEYARKLGFDKKQILMHNLVADLSRFYVINLDDKRKEYPKRLLYAGRFIPVKGLALLIEAWKQIEDKRGWELTLVGDGVLKPMLESCDDVKVLSYMNQEELSKFCEQCGAFILPSTFEPWALVLQEFAAAGLPLLASNHCGATPYFVVDGFNGKCFEPTVDGVRKAIECLIIQPEERLINWGENSIRLSSRITPSIVAHTLLSVL